MRAVGAAGKIRQTDAVARRGLAGNGAIRIVDGARRFEPDEAGDAKDDGARAFGLHCRAKTSGNDRLALARVIIFEVGHFNHPAAATADGKTPVTFRRRERQMPDAETPDFAARDIAGGVHFIHAPEIILHGIEFGQRRIDGRDRLPLNSGEVMVASATALESVPK